jgi:hypothetical protein
MKALEDIKLAKQFRLRTTGSPRGFHQKGFFFARNFKQEMK